MAYGKRNASDNNKVVDAARALVIMSASEGPSVLLSSIDIQASSLNNPHGERAFNGITLRDIQGDALAIDSTLREVELWIQRVGWDYIHYLGNNPRIYNREGYNEGQNRNEYFWFSQ